MQSIDLSQASGTGVLELATFYVGELRLASDLKFVREINRYGEVTPVPLAPSCVRGVINLRGDVVTVVDLGVLLGLDPIQITSQTRQIIVHCLGEQFGLLVDRVSDTMSVPVDALEVPPANVRGTDASLLRGVYRLPNELLMILDTQAVLSQETSHA